MKKYILGIITGIVFMIVVGVSAAFLYNAKDVEFSSKDESWNVTNVEDALNDIKDNYYSSSEVNELVKVLGSWNYTYTGNYQEYVVPVNGTYKIELWGASGGNGVCAVGTTYANPVSRGAYTSGEINLEKGTKLYVYVGGQGSVPTGYARITQGGWNGGGIGGNGGGDDAAGSGGGATDIRIVSTSAKNAWNELNSLRSRIMVAAGGGGIAKFPTSNPYQNTEFISGGGLTIPSQISPSWTYNCTIPTVSQTSGFNFGGVAGLTITSETSHGHGGGGGGWYTGSSCHGSNHGAPGSGGTSYISGHEGSIGIKSDGTASTDSISYTKYAFTNTKMVDGNGYNWTTTKGSNVGMPTYDGKSTMTGNSGNGYARITLLNLD